ncbi:hypothetical protein KO361_04585 [Candidatus Woesearchaeota archaeon]|nr:hypothetical protein [Candidatus Woesearchaeota archaeon]
MEKFITGEMIEKTNLLVDTKLFTELQIKILKKKLQNKKLDSNEKTYYYKFIKPKLSALLEFFSLNKLMIKGEEYFHKNRLDEAQKLMKKLEKQHKNKKIMISGSFLFNKHYEDIDVFIFSKYKKEDVKKKNLHITYLQESFFNSLFFNSLRQISVSNFAHEQSNPEINIKNSLQTFELLINEIISDESYEKTLRDFFLQTEFLKGIILNPKQLHGLIKKFNRKNFEILSNELITSLILFKTRRKLIQDQLLIYEKLQIEYKNAKNIKFYIKTYRETLKFLS